MFWSPRPSRLQLCLAWLRPIEGGDHHADAADPHDTRMGITQETLDTWDGGHRRGVFTIDWTVASAIYDRNYYQANRCDLLPWPLALCVFDTAVNAGHNAQKLLARTRDWSTYLDLRAAFYQALVLAQPAKAPNLEGWLARNARLRDLCQRWS